MIDINNILEKLVNNKPLTKEEKFEILNSKKIDKNIIEYLSIKLKGLYIEVLGKYKGFLFELMHSGALDGWCWQTTESAIIFLNDNDYIERGNLIFDKNEPKYYHSWICFKFNNVEYVLDPCLNFLCKKKDYSKIFETEICGKVSAIEVKNELLKQISMPKQKDNSMTVQHISSILKSIIGDYYEEYEKIHNSEIIVHGSEDVNTPLYRNGAGYRDLEMNGNDIKKLIVHYYYIDC